MFWILDIVVFNFFEFIKGGVKLVVVDLEINIIRKVYIFIEDVVLFIIYLNDVCFDFCVGKVGYVYIIDFFLKGLGVIIVVDLLNGNVFRWLNGVKLILFDFYFLLKVEGEVLMNRNIDGLIFLFRLVFDGIVIFFDGKVLFFCLLISCYFFLILIEIFRDWIISDKDLIYYVEYWGEKGVFDGMIIDVKGIVYVGDYENNSICKIFLNGIMEIIVYDLRILWLDIFLIGLD